MGKLFQRIQARFAKGKSRLFGHNSSNYSSMSYILKMIQQYSGCFIPEGSRDILQ